MTPAHLAYRAATSALHPLAPALLQRRARGGKEDPARLPERLGHASMPRPPGPLVWLHGASVGESLSLLPLIDRLRAARPDLGLLVTSGTTTSAELLARRLPPGAVHQYVPVDTPPSAARFLDHWRPDLAIFVESDLWPNLLLGAKARGARLALLSARLSERSLRGWSRTPAFARRVLGAFDLVMAQDDHVAGGLTRRGGRDDGRLNLKLVGEPLEADASTVARVRSETRDRPVLLAASTHSPEESHVLEAYEQLEDRTDRPLLIIVPRHPSRGEEIEVMARQQEELVTARRSSGEWPDAGTQVYVADTLGELGAWIELCSICFVGGSLARKVGGHNPLEPLRQGRPVVSGPFVGNWSAVYDGLRREEAVKIVDDWEALASWWRQALDDPSSLGPQVQRGAAYAKAQSGQLDAAAARLLALLP